MKKSITSRAFISKKVHLSQRTVGTRDRISSNGDLFIMSNVNPRAIISANNNVYVWGKLFSISFAGKNRNKNGSISPLYLNPLQLRICEIVAIGSKDRLKNKFSEIAILEDNKIIIKP